MTDVQQQSLDLSEGEAAVELDDRSPRPSRRARRSRRSEQEGTSRQRLQSAIKTARNKLRQDAGLSGDTDRVPQLTWLLFLKALDDFELGREEEQGDAYETVIEAPFRWRDWAGVTSTAERMTGDELLDFVNGRLLPYLRERAGTAERDLRTLVGMVFQGVDNRIRSGYILREVVDLLGQINFNASDDIHTVSFIYESILREMRDAAGDAGEFYTPRPVVRFIVDRLNPKLGERVLDPACGTCGFLVEAWEHMKGEARTPEARRQLEQSVMGTEKKPLPYLLGVTNLLLHGVEYPNVVERNPLSTNLRNIQDDDRVDVILINPPFGGEEEPGILNNFPQGMRTSETSLLFLQYIMATLKRPGGRAGIVLPNGFLSGKGVSAEVKKELLDRFNLHTIVRLPNGVFEPYTPIPTNLLFFDACDSEAKEACTCEVWYYELPLPEGRKKYTKTNPLQWEEFAGCRTWWGNREENDHAWRVSVQEIAADAYNLDRRNPSASIGFAHLPPEQLVESILEKEHRILELLGEVKLDLLQGRSFDYVAGSRPERVK